MKSFLKIMLATIVGIIISGLILFFVLVGIVTALSKDKPVEVKPHSILKIELNREIVDRTSDSPFSNLKLKSLSEDKKTGLNSLLENIKKAANDDNITGIYLEVSMQAIRIATVEEIRNALIEFKKTGKFIVAYSELYTQSLYYLSSVADKIYLTPEGDLMFLGLKSQQIFLKGTLEKLGIQPEIIRHGKYKSAVEPLMSEKMSEANREQVMVYIGSIWDHMLKGISESRKIEVSELKRFANEMLISNAEACVKYKMVDSLIYIDQVLHELSRISGNTGGKPNFITLQKYDKVPKKSETIGLIKEKIAVVFASGDIVTGKGDENNIGSDHFSEVLREIRSDSSVKAIVLRVNSGGGSALASEVIWREVQLASKTKPVIASLGDVAASGGYYIVTPAQTIVASPNTITGSIGVFGVLFNGKDFLKNKLGITTDIAETNEHADLGSFFRPLTDQEKSIVQLEVDKIYKSFVTRVSEGRNKSFEHVDSIGGGRVWSGVNAKTIGLIDEFGGLNKAIEIAAQKAGLKKYRVVDYPKFEDSLEKFINEIIGDEKIKMVKEELGENYKYYQYLHQIVNYNGIQTRIPFEIDIY